MQKKIKPVNVLVVTYWSYKDALVSTYTLPYVRMIIPNLPPGSKIILFTFEQSRMRYNSRDWKNEQEKMRREQIIIVRMKYNGFGLKAFLNAGLAVLKLTWIALKYRVSTIHAWCTPAGMIAYWVAKITGKRLIIDSFEPHADSMVENGDWSPKSFEFRILSRYERKMTKNAVACIGTSSKMFDYAVEKFGLKPNHFFVKPAGVDTNFFAPDPEKRKNERLKRGFSEDTIVGIYIGKFGGIYLKEEIFHLLSAASGFWKEKFVMLIYTSTDLNQLQTMMNDFRLSEHQIQIHAYVEHISIPEILSVADFALNPVKPVPSKRYCTSVKDGEYWAMGLPVIIPLGISDDSEMIAVENIGVIWDDFSPAGCMTAIHKMNDLLNSENLQQTKRNIRMLAINHREFKNAEKIYKELY